MSANTETLAYRIFSILVNNGEPMKISDINSIIDDKPYSTVRGRIYDNLGKLFVRKAKGVYWIENEEAAALIVHGDGRDLSVIPNSSIDAIITDHPWLDLKSNIGGGSMGKYTYEAFQYKIEDFQEKSRVLKEGGFLVEILPAENESNYEYLYNVKQMAKECGFRYYAKVPWKKGTFVSNTGRKSKNTEDVMFFTKGTARSLRPDTKKIRKGAKDAVMSGTSIMLPTVFDVQPPSRKERKHQAEKPVKLFEQIIKAVTQKGELILDQFVGSGSVAKAALKTGRLSIVFEIMSENINKMVKDIKGIALLSPALE